MASPDEILDATGLTLLPGFVDIHSHGRGGADFCDATDEAFETIGRGKLQDGVTSFLATGLTQSEETLAELCRCVERYREKAEKLGGGGERTDHTIVQPSTFNLQPFSTCLGVHLEGPFFNPKMAGAQNPAFLRDPDADFVLRLNAISRVLKVSLAPELPGAEACIRTLADAGIVVSLGHSDADYDTFERSRAAGATHLTHFCNAMMPIHHLRPTMVTGGLLADDVYAEIITDGVHLSDPMIRLIAKAKGSDRLMIVTDAMCAAGEPDGIYSLGGLRVKVEKGKATLADVPYDPKAVVSNVAGSVALFPQCFKRFVRVTGWPLHEAVRAAGYNQLRSLGITDRGEVKEGQIADFVLVDADLNPQFVVCRGAIVPVGAFPRNARVGGSISTAGVVQARLPGSSRNCPHGRESGSSRNCPHGRESGSSWNCPHGSIAPGCDGSAVSPVGAFPRNAQVGGVSSAAGVVQARLTGSSRNCPHGRESGSSWNCPHGRESGSSWNCPHGSIAPGCDDSCGSIAPGCDDSASPVGAFRRNAPLESYSPPSPGFYCRFGHARVWYGDLPHWQQANVATFVTLRAAGSLPQERLEELREFDERFRGRISAKCASRMSDSDGGRCSSPSYGQFAELPPRERIGQFAELPPRELRAQLRGCVPRGRISAKCAEDPEYRDYLFRRRQMVEKWLDAGEGPRPFESEAVRRAIENSIWTGCPDRFALYSLVVKPNHVHILLQPNDEFVEKDIAAIKKFSARAVNRLNGTTGSVWQREHYDTLIRDAAHFQHVRDYIWKNDPSRAWDYVRSGAFRGNAPTGEETCAFRGNAPTGEETCAFRGNAPTGIFQEG